MTDMDFNDLQRLLWTFAQHRTLTVAARTGILDALAQAWATSDEVAERLGLDVHATGKVIRALHALGVVASDDDRYAISAGLRPHFQPGPGNLTAFMEHSHDMYESWGQNLEPWLRGEAWQTQPRDPESTRRFGEAMRAMGLTITPRVAKHIDLEGVRTMLDVGGGFGQYSISLCERSPGLRSTVVDRSSVTEQASLSLAGTPWADRVAFLGGDYLEVDLGTGFDLVLIANILHQESETRAAELIRRATRALNPGGRVTVVDFQIDDEQRRHPLGTLFAINMRSFGDTYPEPTITGWMDAAGLADITRIDIDPDRWLITGTKPAAIE